MFLVLEIILAGTFTCECGTFEILCFVWVGGYDHIFYAREGTMNLKNSTKLAELRGILHFLLFFFKI